MALRTEFTLSCGGVNSSWLMIASCVCSLDHTHSLVSFQRWRVR